ncbi:hypothetical protein PIB30_087388 [Stylosanthes scabra]|uniref:AB hydrolase-1 domain-containing protein n=1 Tax=Stylosanthes scabra TaxID=79078 RepID=A0ABU6XUI3_9FABA|nr:hypothetical protein [Stylosanthes scabra]
MVNLVATYCSFLKWLIKITAGVRPYTPVVVLLHGFCGDGIMTWQFQIASLSKHYSVYVPDFLFFGGSFTDRTERSLEFQAECLAVGLGKLGVEKCVLVGFSYGAMVAFKIGEIYPELVHAMVISGAVATIKQSIIVDIVRGTGLSSCSEMLMPTTVDGLKRLLSVGLHRNITFPRRLHNNFLKVLCS